MRLAARWWRRLLVNLAAAFVLAIAPTIIITLLVQSLLAPIPPAQIREASVRSWVVDFLLSRYSLLWMLVLAGAFLFVRTGISLLIWWNRLRRRSLVLGADQRAPAGGGDWLRRVLRIHRADQRLLYP